MKRFRILGTFLLALGLGAGNALADRVILKNGQELTGEIVEERDATITFKTTGSTLQLPRARIREVIRSSPGMLEVQRARAATQAGDLQRARGHYDNAAQEGAPPAVLDSLKAEIDALQAEQELARYSEMIEEARVAARQGVNSQALADIRNLITTLEPDSPSRAELVNILCEYHLARANEHTDKVRIQQAVEELRKVIELDPSRAQAYMDLADIWKQSGSTLEQALVAYREAIEHAQGNLTDHEVTRAYWEIAEIHRQQSNWREASTAYREAYRRNPSYSIYLRDRLIDAFRFYANAVERERPELALAVVDEALVVREDEDLRLLRGRLLHQVGRDEEAINSLQELLADNPQLPMANYHLAQSYLAEGEILSAREALRREIAIDARNYSALLQLGDLALQRDDYNAAEDFYLRARALEPDSTPALLSLGRTYRRKTELDKAKTYVQQVLARFPDDREANLEMGRILLDEEKLEEAKEFFSEVLRLVEEAQITGTEDAEELKRLMADALIARGEINLLTAGPGTANKDFRQALEVLPDYGQAYYSIGIAYRKKFASTKRMDDLEQSEENLLKSRELAPENAQFALELGILYSQHMAQADPDNSSKYLGKAVENWQAYLDLGGANQGQVRRWIAEVGG